MNITQISEVEYGRSQKIKLKNRKRNGKKKPNLQESQMKEMIQELASSWQENRKRLLKCSLLEAKCTDIRYEILC